MNEKVKTIFCSRLNELLIENDISQNKLSKIIGVRQNTVSAWANTADKNGKIIDTMPNAEALTKIAQALNTSVDYLLGLSDEKKSGAVWNYSDVFEILFSLNSEVPFEICFADHEHNEPNSAAGYPDICVVQLPCICFAQSDVINDVLSTWAALEKTPFESEAIKRKVMDTWKEGVLREYSNKPVPLAE